MTRFITLDKTINQCTVGYLRSVPVNSQTMTVSIEMFCISKDFRDGLIFAPFATSLKSQNRHSEKLTLLYEYLSIEIPSNSKNLT